MYFKQLFILSILLINSIRCQKVNLLCTAEFCTTYKDTHECPSLPEACLIQNATHNGQIFKSTSPCGCCEFCLIHLKEGDFCSIGSPGSPLPSFMCGPGLYCFSDPDVDDGDPRCIKMDNTDCTRKQIEFDQAWKDGEIGHLMRRPLCDGNGNFEPIKCIPGQICYCIDKNGNRIFGEAIHTSITESTMRCECSRLAANFFDLMKSPYPQFTARCQDDGSYDPIQCIGDQCVCVHSNTAEIESTIFNATHGLANMIDCFDVNKHTNNSYLHECETIEMEKVNEIIEFEQSGYKILDFQLNICDPNGWFKRVAENDTHYYCADKYSNKIEDYGISKVDAMASNINCNCARARLLMIENNLRDLPLCCPNGNYRNVACRRNECYCVDDNGNQISVEVLHDNMESLPCYNDGEFC